MENVKGRVESASEQETGARKREREERAKKREGMEVLTCLLIAPELLPLDLLCLRDVRDRPAEVVGDGGFPIGLAAYASQHSNHSSRYSGV